MKSSARTMAVWKMKHHHGVDLQSYTGSTTLFPKDTATSLVSASDSLSIPSTPGLDLLRQQDSGTPSSSLYFHQITLTLGRVSRVWTSTWPWFSLGLSSIHSTPQTFKAACNFCVSSCVSISRSPSPAQNNQLSNDCLNRRCLQFLLTRM